MFEKIETDPKICHGKPCIKGTRIPVEMILNLVGEGYTFDRIIKECYPNLTKEDITAAIKYAEAVIKNEEVYPLGIPA